MAAGALCFAQAVSADAQQGVAAELDYMPIRALLVRSRPGEKVPEPKELAQALAALGPPAVPELYEIATGRGLDALIGEVWVSEQWPCLPEELPPLAEDALALAPRAAFLAQLEAVLASERTVAELRIVLRLLADPRVKGELGLVLRCAEKIGDLEVLRPSVRAGLRATLARILSSEPQVWPGLEARLGTLAPAFTRVLVEAIGEARRPEGMPILRRLCGREEPPTELVVEAMTVLELERPWSLGGQTLAVCKSWWAHPDVAVRTRVASLAARLGGPEEVEALIRLSSDAQRGVRHAATLALEAIGSIDARAHRHVGMGPPALADGQGLSAEAPGALELELRHGLDHELGRRFLAATQAPQDRHALGAARFADGLDQDAREGRRERAEARLES
ncbi:MAG: hypothetical protein ABL998_19915, partial [Planctomycetota bacterium]